MGSRRDQILAISLVTLVVVLALLVAPGEEQGGLLDLRTSTLRRSPNGALALYLSLEELGVPVQRRLTPYVDADSLAGPLALLAPAESPTPTELSALARWIEAGGVLLYAARPGDAVLDTLGLALAPLIGPEGARESDPRTGVSAFSRPHRLTAGVGKVSGFRWSFADTSRALQGSEVRPLLMTPEGETVVLIARRGEGRVVAWSDPRPLSNAALRESGAALLFARTAAAATAGRGPLTFDEYHHGYRAGGSPVEATLGFLRDAALGHAALQLAVAGLGLLLLLGRRFGSPLPPAPARRRSPLEHVEALAGAYRQAGARTTARHLLVTGLARRLGRPLPARGREAELLARLASQPSAGGEAAEALLAEWRKGEHADLVRLARQIDTLILETQRP